MNAFELLFKYPPEVFTQGRLFFQTRLPVEAVILAALVGAAVVWWLYRRVAGRISRRMNLTLTVLRALLLATAVGLVAAPALRVEKPRRHTVFTAVVVDTSRSMSLPDADAQKTSRLLAARGLLGDSQTGLLADLGKDATVLLYGFDRDLQRLSDIRQLAAEGRFTNYFRSLRALDEDLRGLPVAGVVLLTDGCRNDGGSTADAARLLAQRGIPLHIVGIGNPAPPRDIEVQRVLAPTRVRRNSEVDAWATIRHTGYTQPLEITLTRAGTVLRKQTFTPQAGSDMERVRLTFTPDYEGAATYTVAIAPQDGEALTDNNARDFTMDMQDDRLPVLYVEGSPRTEYRYLRRALFRDQDFRLVSILRLSSRSAEAVGAKGPAGGASGGTSGGGMGFYVQGANAAEAYLAEGFPKRSEDLFAFQALILGDIEAEFFTPAQLQMIEQFVRQRGGGLLMLGGVNSFGLGHYAGTPVESMLPVTIARNDPPYSDETFQALPTSEALPAGNPHLLMRLTSDEVANRRLWENAPPLIGLTPVRGVKLGATPLLVHEKSKLPVLAVQNYGQGRVGAFLSGGSWYWQMSKPASDEFHERFWKQMVRWLVVGAKERITVETGATVSARGEPVMVRATILGKDMLPVNDARVTAVVTDPQDNAQEYPMDWNLAEEGVYQATFVPAAEGTFKIKVRVDGRATGGEDWSSVKPVETEARVSEPLVEFSQTGLREDVLQAMAQATGGQYYPYGGAGKLAENLRQAIAQVKQATAQHTVKPLWDMPVWLLLIVALGGAEWFLRRRSGLA